MEMIIRHKISPNLKDRKFLAAKKIADKIQQLHINDNIESNKSNLIKLVDEVLSTFRSNGVLSDPDIYSLEQEIYWELNISSKNPYVKRNYIHKKERIYKKVIERATKQFS